MEISALYSSLLGGLITLTTSGIFALASYVLGAMALYSIAQRRGLSHAWLAWLPIADLWLLGSIADQYSYVREGKVKNRRKILLIFRLLGLALVFAACAVGIAGLFQAISYKGFLFPHYFGRSLLGMLVLALPGGILHLIFVIFRFIALNDVYKSLDPANASLYLVLSILFPVTTAFFLFFNREKELGMPGQRLE